MKKHIVMFGILTAFLWSTQFVHIPTFANETGFPDVLPDVWYTNYIEEVVDDGIMQGLPDGTFGTWKLVDRAELAKVIIELKRQVQGHWLKDNLFEIILILATVFGWLSILNSFKRSQENMLREIARMQSNGGPPPPSPPPAPKAPVTPQQPTPSKDSPQEHVSPTPAPAIPAQGGERSENKQTASDPDAIEKNLKSNWWV